MGRRQFPEVGALQRLADVQNGLQRPQGITTATGKAEDQEAIERHNRLMRTGRVGQAIRDYSDARGAAERAWGLTEGGSDRQSAAWAAHEQAIRKLVAQGLSTEVIFDRLGSEPKWMPNTFAVKVAEAFDERCSTALAILQGVLLEFEPVIEDWCQANPDYGKAVRSAVDSILGLA